MLPLYGSLIALQGLDIHSTRRALSTGGAREANPLMRPIVNDSAAFLATKAAATAGLIWASEKMWKKNNRRAAVILVSLVNTAMATEQVCKRFDTLLKRRLKDGDEQRGLIVFAESHYEQRAKLWVKGFRELGTQWGLLHSLCDIPYFAPAKESRLLQLADYVAHALFLLFEKQDATLIKEIVKKFDQADGVLHGLVHISDQRGTSCDCPACFSRRSPWHFGPLVS